MSFLVCAHLKRGANVIKVTKEKSEHSIFEIKGYFFVEVESKLPTIPIYQLIINKQFDSSLDVRYWLAEISGYLQALSEYPSELTEYIKKYEENIHFKDIYLFHDLRTRYIDFYLYDEKGLKNNVLLIGYTLLRDKTCIAIKAFSFKGLAAFAKVFDDYCANNQILVESHDFLKWMQLEQSMLSDTNLQRNDLFEEFLQKTLENDYCNIFINAFYEIDSRGYLGRDFFEKTLTIQGQEKKVDDIKQFKKYFAPFWKTEIDIRTVNRTVLCLHDELLNNESMVNMVYTIKPHLMQYYKLHWFEDFCSEIIKNITQPEFKIINNYCGRKFNFFQDGDNSKSREIDMIFCVKCKGDYKIIAIECKKTLSNKEIQVTNGKIKDKILKSSTNVIDAYIHIGCFNNDVKFDKKVPNSHEKYKQGLIQSRNKEIPDVPYFAFSASAIENLKIKMSFVIKEIFSQW